MASEILDEKAVFNVARQIASPDARAEYLRQACGADSGLRERVLGLLRAYEEQASFLESPAPVGVVPTIDQPASESPGDVIGPYKLLEQIGEGGMGTVWMAQQTAPVKRVVALKLIKAGMDSKQIIARFEAERQALALMDHANIARVLDAGTTSAGRPYFVMDLVKVVPITKYCDEHHLTPRQRLELFVPVCQAVQHAHQKGIIHRDLKPSNVVVAPHDGKPVPKIIDFGVAKAAGQSLTDKTLVTGFGSIVGTMEYMSPEQAEINQLDIDTRSDIYSLGVLLYELLAGSPPFTRKELEKAGMLEMLRVIRENEPPKPSTKLSTAEGLPTLAANRGTEPAKLTKLVRGELDWIVMKALEKDRNRRYATANGFAADVHCYLADEPVQACPPSVGYRLRKFVRRNKGPVLAASLVLAALVTGIVGTTSGMIRATHAEADAVREAGEKTVALAEKATALATATANELEAHKQETLAKDNAKIAKEQELLARRRFYAAQVNLALQAWEAGDPARTLDLLETQRPRFDEEDLRSFEWYYLWRLCHQGLRSRLNDDADVVAFLPDGKTLAATGCGSFRLWDVPTGQEKVRWPVEYHWGLSVSRDGTLLGTWGSDDPSRIWDATSGQQLAVFEGTTAPTFLPDGKLIAVVRNSEIEFWDLATKQRHSVLRLAEDNGLYNNQPGLSSFVHTADGKTAIARVTDNSLRIYRWADAKWQAGSEISGHGWCPFTAFSPDGQTFAVGGEVLKLYATVSGKELCTLAGHTAKVNSVAFSPNSKLLASGSSDRAVRVWDLATRKQQSCYPHLGPVVSVAFSPDGKQLASAGDLKTIQLWQTTPVPAPSVLKHSGGVCKVSFTPDGTTLISGGFYPIQLWDVATGRAAPLNGHPEREGTFRLSPDGKTLAVFATETSVELWDLATGQARGCFQGQVRLSGAAFSPDGKTLATFGDTTVNLWDVATHKVRTTLQRRDLGSISRVLFSPDSRALVVAVEESSFIVWDLTTGQEKIVVGGKKVFPWWNEHPDPVSSAAFSPDGKTLATGSAKGAITIWNVDTWKLRASLKGHTDTIVATAFSPDGKTLAAASADRVRMWDAATGQERITLKGHTGKILCLDFASDGNTLATGSVDGTVRLWRAAIDPEAKAFRSELDPDDPDSSAALLDQAVRLVAMDRAEESLQTSAKALERLKRGAGVFPDECPKQLASLAGFYGRRGRALARLNRWDRAAADFAKAIELKPDAYLYWADRGTAHYMLKEWDRAIADLSEALKLRDGIWWAWKVRGETYAEMGQWKEAAADLAKAVALNKAEFFSRHLLAMASLRLADVAGYRKVCADMLAQFGQSAKPDSAHWALWTWVLAADAVVDWKVPLQVAEKAVAENPKSYRALNQHGAALYRASKYQEALKRLTEAESAYQLDDEKLNAIAYNWLFLAMTRQRLGHIKEAKKWHEKAMQWIDQEMQKSKEPAAATPLPWYRRLALQLLRREAEELLNMK
jgi:WD40 repeat protein/serine/threonine protein kinase/tetratricopeptide (TPR) repeat protein